MATHTLAALSGGAVAASYFMPWFRGPFGASFVPHEVLTDPVLDRAADMPAEVAVFLSSFALAAVVAVATLAGRAPRLVMIAVPLLPLGLVARALLDIRGQMRDLGLPVPRDMGLPDMMRMVSDFVDFGLWAYVGGAALLLVLGLFGPGISRR